MLAALDANECEPRPTAGGDGWSAHCPVHGDRKASLGISAGDDGRALVLCRAGCSTREVVAALGLKMRDLFAEGERPRATIAATYVYTNEVGAPLFECVRFFPKDFRQRHRNATGEWEWNLKGVQRVPYHLPEVRAAVADGRTIYVAEGEKDVDNLRALGLVATCNPMGAGNGKWRPEYTESLRGAPLVVIIADKDEPGRKHAARIARTVQGAVGRVVVLEMPGPGKDASDWIAAGGTKADLERIVADALRAEPPAAEPEPDARPEFQVRKGYGHEAVVFAVGALARHPTTYQREGRLVTVVAWEPPSGPSTLRREPGAPIIRDLSAPTLWERLSELVAWCRFDARKDDLVYCDPPHDVVAAVLQRGEWPGVRELRGIVTSPVLRPDGSLLEHPGYDSSTGLIYCPSGPCAPIPDRPTIADARAALELLLEIVCDFPFAEPAHRSAWLAALLTPFAAPAIGDANRPLFLVDGNTRGCGKSRLVDCVAIIVTGRSAARQSYTPNSEELDKRVIALLQAGDQLALLDNVTGDFGGPVLDKLLTSEGWYAGRLLGSNDAAASLKLRNCATWYATANNATLAGDLVRRAVHIRLATTLEHPEERADFRHADLLRWVRQERPRLLSAALTVLRAWFEAGQPDAGLPAFGSFEAWSAIVRNVCVWLGQPDPWAETRVGLRVADPGDTLHAALLAGIAAIDRTGHGVSTGEIKRWVELDLEDAHEHDCAPRFADLEDALGAAGILEDGKVNAQKLGRRIQLLKDRRKGGACIRASRDNHGNVSRWVVERGSGCGSLGVAGVVQPSACEMADEQ